MIGFAGEQTVQYEGIAKELEPPDLEPHQKTCFAYNGTLRERSAIPKLWLNLLPLPEHDLRRSFLLGQCRTRQRSKMSTMWPNGYNWRWAVSRNIDSLVYDWWGSWHGHRGALPKPAMMEANPKTFHFR